MKYISFSLALIYLFLKKSALAALGNPSELTNGYPFSLKKGYNEAVIFIENSISIFDVTKTSEGEGPIGSVISDDIRTTFTCNSGEEKGGIYFKSYYYTSCLNEVDVDKFKIIIYRQGGTEVKTITSSDFSFSTGSIRFFRKSSTEELVGVAWLDNNKFNIYQLNENGIIVGNSRGYTISSSLFGRDIDCLFINKYQRIVCIFSYIDSDGQHSCKANIFSGTEADFESNTKTLEGCVDHLSRKIRGNTENNEDSDIFYYYYVGTNGIAYIMPLKLKSTNSIEKVDSNYEYRYEVLKGCDQNQGSFDFAEDKFLGYNVFSCVESTYSTKIKIQLFKIENGLITFSNGDIDNPYIYTDKDFPSSEISMINFVVLKESLNFGFLSYRIEGKAKYTIINQPTCSDINIRNTNFFQFGETEVNFNNFIINDNYDGGEFIIVDYNPGIRLSISENKIYSVDYVTGELEFSFKAKNNYYESELCTGKVYVNPCFENCKSCHESSSDFFDQQCKECKDDYYEMDGFSSDSSKKSCCKENLDCPDYLYLNNGKYTICSNKCLACSKESAEYCISCYNKKNLSKNYSPIEQTKIVGLKYELTDTNQNFWIEVNLGKCTSTKPDQTYLNDENSTFMSCYPSCESCSEGGDKLNHHCETCLTDQSYHHILDSPSNCYLETDEEVKNYYLYNDMYFKKCNESCVGCTADNACIKCADGYYKLCSSTDDEFCYNKTKDNEFIDYSQKCIVVCDNDCETCDGAKDSTSTNCLSCSDPYKILYNKNCISDCPDGYYNFEGQCVSGCPPYTDGVMKEVMRRVTDDKEPRQALTIEQQNRLIDFIAVNKKYCEYSVIITVLLGTGMRIGELLGLRWCDIDFKKGIIYVTHSLAYRPTESTGYVYSINEPKTKAGIREIPMFDDVKKALQKEKRKKKGEGDEPFCIGKYSGFIFLNAAGKVYTPSAVYDKIQFIVDDYNKTEQLRVREEKCTPVYIPKISPHIFRHTFCTRLCELEPNIKVVQEVMGHRNAKTTMNVYYNATREAKMESFKALDGKIRLA